MQLFTALLSLATLCTITFAQPTTARNTSTEYNLRTCLKPKQPGKERFENLWLQAYHTGAGENDAVFVPERSNVSAAGYLRATNVAATSGQQSYNQAFNLGTVFPWQMGMSLSPTDSSSVS